MNYEKIVILTGTRAEYGLLKSVMQKVEADRELEFLLVVTGKHLSSEFGMTVHEIESDVLLLGDRYETMAVCCAAMNARIPVIHLHGGEATEGLIDEAIRHSITKMSYLHFTSTEEYRKRVIHKRRSLNRTFS